MAVAGRDRDDAGEAADLDGDVAGGGGVVPQFTVVVDAPGPHGAVGFDGQAVGGAGRHRHDAGEAADLDGGGPVGVGAVAQLAAVVVAPRPHRAVRFDGQAVRVARGHGLRHRPGRHGGEPTGRIVGGGGGRTEGGGAQGLVAEGVVAVGGQGAAAAGGGGLGQGLPGVVEGLGVRVEAAGRVVGGDGGRIAGRVVAERVRASPLRRGALVDHPAGQVVAVVTLIGRLAGAGSGVARAVLG